MSEHKLVVLNGQILHGNDRLGRWKVTQLEGWGDSPPVRSQDVERPGADGDFDLPTFYGARPVTIGGRVICSSQAAAQQARGRITGLVQGLVRAQVMDEGVTSWADVKLTDAVTTKRTGSLVRFQYQLRAPDPRRFGDANTFTVPAITNVTAFHWGNYPAPPRFVVSGSAPGGYVLTVDGYGFYVTRPLVPGSPHTIDYDDGRLRIGGAVIHGGLGSTTNTPHIEPGTGVMVSVWPLTTGSPTATLTLLDTYI